MQEINLYDENYGFWVGEDSLAEEVALLRHQSHRQKGDIGNRPEKTPEILTGFWGEIIKEDIINLPPIPEPPKMPEPPPSRYSRM
jgi:hypothetical protein